MLMFLHLCIPFHDNCLIFLLSFCIFLHLLWSGAIWTTVVSLNTIDWDYSWVHDLNFGITLISLFQNTMSQVIHCWRIVNKSIVSLIGNIHIFPIYCMYRKYIYIYIYFWTYFPLTWANEMNQNQNLPQYCFNPWNYSLFRYRMWKSLPPLVSAPPFPWFADRDFLWAVKLFWIW